MRREPEFSSQLTAFAAWKEGRAGYPFVDIATRQLLVEGWIPNLPRLVAASLPVEQLRIDWRIGATRFMKLSLDGDAASNSDIEDRAA